jgi:insulysin
MLTTLISATALLMTTLSPSPSVTVVEDRSNLPLLNPDLAERKTLKLRLSNGLEALLISDPVADQSAAAVAVGAGSWSDPEEYPGMAHFCEHMLFMGTKKYPSENEFFSLVSDYAGHSNAYTAPNRTVYMFSAQSAGFLALLDRFAHFFIDPLFNPGNIAREMHAVDQEFAKNLENDDWREYMVFKETGNPDHPNRSFSTGNSQTLGKIPQEALHQWHKKNYGADRTHLAIYSSLPIETLKEAVIQIFSEVPLSQSSPLDHSQPLTSPQQVGHITYIKPIQNRQTLTLSWELSPALSDDKDKSAELLAYALRRGQRHSLYEKLKSEQWIDSMSTRVEELGGRKHRFFQISLELTRQGIEHVDAVALRCFEAIAGLKQANIPSYLFQEKNAMAQLNYQYQDRQNPFDFIMKLGDSLLEEELATFPRQTLLASAYAPKKLARTATQLTPETCSLVLMASPELTQVAPTHKEKWFGTEYAIQPIPQDWLAQWKGAKPHPDIRLADPNPFLPSHLALVPDPNLGTTPTLIADDDLGLAYYIRSSEFGVPEADYHIHILSPELTQSARSAVLTSLYLDHLTDLLHPTLAAANAAGLTATFDLDRCALHLHLNGYSEKAPLLLQEIVKQMAENLPTPEQFALYVDRHEKSYFNAQKELVVRQAKELLDSIVNRDKSTSAEQLAALKTISYDDFLSFAKKLFETTYIKALFAGNLSMKDAESAWLDVIHVLGKTPYPKTDHPQPQILQLPAGKGPYQIAQSTESQGNATLLLIDQGSFTFENRAVQEMLATALKEPFFSELRSKQKTGYIVQSYGAEQEERLFQYFLVQSNSHQPDDLLYRFEQFIEEFNDSLSEQMSTERFETLKASLIDSLKTRFRNLKDKTALWDKLAFEKEGDFTFIEKRILALATLTHEDFFAKARASLHRNNRKRLAILFEGKLDAPFVYHLIDRPELGDLFRLRGIGDVDRVHGAGAVVGEEDELSELRILIHVHRVHAGGDAVGELGDCLGVQRVARVGDDDAVLAIGRAFAREHEELAVGERHHVVHAPRVRDHRVGDSRVRRIADVQRVQHVASRAGAEVRVLAVLVQPHLFGAEPRPRQPSDQRERATHVALGQIHRSFDAARAERCRHGVLARLVADERTVFFDHAVSRREAPRRREAGDRTPTRILRLHGEAQHVTRSRFDRGGRERQ